MLALLVGSYAAVSAAQPSAEKAPTTKPGAAVAAAAKAAPAPLSEAEQKRRAQPLVWYQGRQITIGEIEDSIARQNAFMRSRYKDPQNLKELLEKTLRFYLLSDEAEKRGYGKDELVQQSVKQNAVQFLMKAEIDDKLGADSIPKADIEKYYQDHVEEYVQPALQRASQIVCASEADAKAALEQAKGMDLRAYRQLARDKSTDQATKLSGGDLRYFDVQGKVHGETALAVPPAVAKAAFTLKTIGDLYPKPVKTDAGFVVVKLTGQRPAISRKLAEVEEAIRTRLWRERRQQASDQLVKSLEAQAKPEVHPELLAAIKLDEAPLGGPALGLPPPAMPPGAPAPAAPAPQH